MRILKRLALAVVVVIGVAVAGWYFFLKSDPEPRAAIEETPIVSTQAPVGSTGSTGSSGTTASLDGTYTVKPGDSSNFVGYRVTEKLIADVVQTTATGRTNNVTGSMTISGTTISDVTVTADLRSLTSDNDLRDGRLRDQGIESNRFPQAKFVLTTPITLAALPTAGETIKVDAVGDFTLHGVSKSVTIPLEARWDGKAVQAVGTLPVVFGDYKITAPSSTFVASIDDHAEMELKLFFEQS